MYVASWHLSSHLTLLAAPLLFLLTDWFPDPFEIPKTLQKTLLTALASCHLSL